MPVEQMDLFYHAEPFDVACNIAGQPLDVRDHLEDYLEIRDGATHRAATLARSK